MIFETRRKCKDSTRRMDNIIVIEGGGTHTRAALFTGTGAVEGELSGGPSNPAAYGLTASARCIGALAHAALGDVDIHTVRLVAAVAGAASDEARAALAAAIGAAFPAREIRVASDLHALLYANAGDAAGMLAIAGTGAAVLARDDAGNLARTGGWGILFGDEGSSYAVVKSALRACARFIDGVGMETSLVEALPRAAGLNVFFDFVAWQANAGKGDIAALAPVVSVIAEQGDTVARACIEEEARRLAALAVSARHRLGLPPKAPLFEYGGLLENCSVFRQAFRETVEHSSDMRPLPAMKRGLDAVSRLARPIPAPSWISIWTPEVSATPVSLPDTEQVSSAIPIDRLSPLELVHRMHHADKEAVGAVLGACAEIASAIEQAAACIRRGGRIIYAGAGTSGRLGVLDASECPPTFGVSPERVSALIAGGDRALRNSVEGAEDRFEEGEADLGSLRVSDSDFVIGIAASGTTPYVEGVLAAAREAGASTALITSNRNSPIAAPLRIILETGPEVLAGSTRLKAGTATKLALNMISTGAFTGAGYVYQGRMVGMTPANEKLRHRAVRIVSELAGIPEARAAALLADCGYHIATALLMAGRGVTRDEAEALLARHESNLRDALASDNTGAPRHDTR